MSPSFLFTSMFDFARSMFNVLFLFLLLLLLFATPPTHAQPPGFAQTSDLYIVPAGGKFLRWYGHAGRSYFIQISDTDNPLGKWRWAPIIESGNEQQISYEVDGTPAKGFFRFKYTNLPIPLGETLETADFDGDGLSNLDEISPLPGALFGQTDPLNGDTDSDSLPDGWERDHGLDPNDDGGIDPDNGASGDPDGDGKPNFKEYADQTNPKNGTDFAPEWIWVNNRVNGYTGHSNTTPDQGELRSWNWQRLQLDVKDLSAALQPVTVYNELLTIPFPATAGEARADAFSNVTRVDLAWNAYPDAYADYYVSPELEGYGFSHAAYLSTRAWLHLPPLPIAQQLPFLKVTRYAQDGYDPNDFEESFEAEAVSLTVPANQSYSTFIDLDTSASGIAGTSSAHVELRQIRIIPGSGMAGVVGDMVKSTRPGSMVGHFVTPRRTTDINQTHVELKAQGISASEFSQFLVWEGGEAGSSAEKRKVSRESADPNVPIEVKIKMKIGGAVLARLFVWVVWADVKSVTKGTPSFSQYPNQAGVKYEIEENGKWRFVFKIQPDALFDQSVIERPDLVGKNTNPAPGAAKPHTLNPAVAGDDATRKWDVSRQIQVTIRNPGGVNTQGLTPAAWYANQPQPEATPVAFPGLDVEGNDDPKLEDEDGNPYGPCTRLSLEHEKGEISSSDFPRLSIAAANGVADAFFTKELDFREFARLELWDGKRTTGQFWFRISGYQKWHHHLRTTFNGTTSNWENTGSSADQDD